MSAVCARSGIRGSRGRGYTDAHQEIDELVDDWTPEPLVAAPTQLEELENEKRPVIVGCVSPALTRPRQLMCV